MSSLVRIFATLGSSWVALTEKSFGKYSPSDMKRTSYDSGFDHVYQPVRFKQLLEPLSSHLGQRTVFVPLGVPSA